MRVSFFEEFPTPENLQPAAFLRPPCRVYLAAPSPEKFRQSKQDLAKINQDLEASYWPILPQSYWVSPFSKLRELQNLRNELVESKFRSVLIDLELPILAKGMILQNLPGFFSHKRLLKDLPLYPEELVTAEYPALGPLTQSVLEFLGLSMPRRVVAHTKIVMFYTSFLRSLKAQRTIKRQIIRLHHEWPGSIHVGLGTIATGVFGTEGIVPARELREQIRFFRSEGIPEVTIYRLGGVQGAYLDAIREAAFT